MDWPIFYKDELKLGNPESSVGICTLWTKKEILHSKITESKYAVCGNLYTIQGINPMLKNILAKPHIRHIILCGADLMQSGDALLNFVSKGLDGSRKIVDSSGYIDSNVDLDLIEKFRQHIKVVDMRGRENDVPKVVESINDPPRPFIEPVFITELEQKPVPLKTEEIAFKVRGKGIAETWLKILDVVMKFGEEKESEYKVNQKEIIDLIALVEDGDDKIAEWMNINETDIENYFATFFTEEKPFGVTYTYGNRLLRHPVSDGFFNQIQHAMNCLKSAAYTRRAVAVTWNVDIDRNSKDPPCITQIVWNAKKGKLYQTAVIRSNDMFGAWPLNAYALRKLQKDVAESLGLGIGTLATVSNSAHIYENNWKEAKTIVDKYHTHRIVSFSEDENGYFIIKVENGEIAVEHYTKEGLPSGYVFRGNKAQILYRKIMNENLISLMDHAAYIGHELARAEIALKEGKKFVQDEA